MATRGERLRQALEVRGVKKQQALAAELAVHESSITRWKENAAMSLESAIALSSTLDISLDWLLLGRGTIDSHKVAAIRPDESIFTDNPELQQISRQVSQRSISLLSRMIASITEDIIENRKR